MFRLSGRLTCFGWWFLWYDGAAFDVLIPVETREKSWLTVDCGKGNVSGEIGGVGGCI